MDRRIQTVRIPIGERTEEVRVPNLVRVAESAYIPGVPDARAEVRPVENNYNFERTVQYVNKLIQRIVEKEPDLIITGIQSGIVPYAFSNLAFLTNRHLEVLTGILPDAIVLCINPNDDVTLIKRAIATVENYIQATVLCCALFPLKYSEQFQIYGKKEMLNAIEQDTLISELENKIGLKVFPMNSIGVSKIASLIVEYFSE